jgi:hypothetical protein
MREGLGDRRRLSPEGLVHDLLEASALLGPLHRLRDPLQLFPVDGLGRGRGDHPRENAFWMSGAIRASELRGLEVEQPNGVREGLCTFLTRPQQPASSLVHAGDREVDAVWQVEGVPAHPWRRLC